MFRVEPKRMNVSFSILFDTTNARKKDVRYNILYKNIDGNILYAIPNENTMQMLYVTGHNLNGIRRDQQPSSS